jgi:hypothetical protein
MDMSAEKSSKSGKKMSHLNNSLINARGELNVCTTHFSQNAHSHAPPTLFLPENIPDRPDPPGNASPGDLSAPPRAPVEPANRKPATREPATRKPATCKPAAPDDPPWELFADSREPATRQPPARKRLKRETVKPANLEPSSSLEPLSLAAQHFKYCYPDFNMGPLPARRLQGWEAQYGLQRVIDVIDWASLKGIPRRDVLHVVQSTLRKWTSAPEGQDAGAEAAGAAAPALTASRPGMPDRKPPPLQAAAGAEIDPDEQYLQNNPNGPHRQAAEERLRQKRLEAQNGDSR